MLQRLWDFICYLITGANKNAEGVRAKWDYSFWTRFRYGGTHRRGCGKHNLRGRMWVVDKDFRSSFDWIEDWKNYWDEYWMEHSWT